MQRRCVCLDPGDRPVYALCSQVYFPQLEVVGDISNAVRSHFSLIWKSSTCQYAGVFHMMVAVVHRRSGNFQRPSLRRQKPGISGRHRMCDDCN